MRNVDINVKALIICTKPYFIYLWKPYAQKKVSGGLPIIISLGWCRDKTCSLFAFGKLVNHKTTIWKKKKYYLTRVEEVTNFLDQRSIPDCSQKTMLRPTARQKKKNEKPCWYGSKTKNNVRCLFFSETSILQSSTLK